MKKIYVVHFQCGRYSDYRDISLRAFTDFKTAEKWKKAAEEEAAYLLERLKEARDRWDGEVHPEGSDYFNGTEWLHKNNLSPRFYECLDEWDLISGVTYSVEGLDLYEVSEEGA